MTPMTVELDLERALRLGASQKFQSIFNAWKFPRQNQLGSSRTNATILFYYI